MANKYNTNIILNRTITITIILFLWVFCSYSQIATYSLDGNLTDTMNGFNATYVVEENETDISQATFVTNNGARGVLLGITEGVKFPIELSQQLTNSSSFEFELGFIYVDQGNDQGQKTIVSFKQNDSSNSSGIHLYAKYKNTDQIELTMLWADGRATSGDGQDYNYHANLGTYPIGELININFNLDFDKAIWSILINDRYFLFNFDYNFDMDHFKENMSTSHIYLGWLTNLDVNFHSSLYSGSIACYTFNVYKPRKPSNVNLLTTALDQMTNYILGNISLSDEEINNYTIDVIVNHSKNYTNAKNEIDSYLDAYEENYPTLFESNSRVDVTQFSGENRIAFYLQQDIHDNEFVTGNVESMEGVKFKAANIFPGSVSDNAPRIEDAKVTINATYLRDPGYYLGFEESGVRRPTGYYAAPGELITITTSAALANKGLQVLVGAHARDLSNKITETNRFSRVSKTYDIISTETKVANPFGGAIYIKVPKDVDFGWVDVEIDGAVKSPYFRYLTGQPTTDVSEWLTDINNAHVSWADFESDKMMFTIPRSSVDTDNPTNIMATWNNMWDAASAAAGRPLNRIRSEYFLLDRRMPYGSFGGGYPTTFENGGNDPVNNIKPNQWWSPLNVLKPDYVTNTQEGTMLHELGHTMGFPTMPGELETIITLLRAPMYNVGLGLDIDTSIKYLEAETHDRDLAAMNWLITDNFRNNNEMGCDPTMPISTCSELRYQIRGSAKYWDIAVLFGWEGLGAINKVFYDQWASNGTGNTSDNYNITREQYIQAATEALGVNLTPLLHFWGIIPSEAQKNELKPFPNSELIKTRLEYYKTLIPETKDEFQAWYNNLRATVDPVHYDRLDWTFNNYDSEGLAQQMKNQIDFIITEYFGVLSVDSNNLIQTEIYPNPSKGNFTINLGKIYQNIEVIIFNILGKTVLKQHYPSTKTIDFSLKGAPGLYIATIKTNNGEKMTIKVLKN